MRSDMYDDVLPIHTMCFHGAILEPYPCSSRARIQKARIQTVDHVTANISSTSAGCRNKIAAHILTAIFLEAGKENLMLSYIT